MGAGILVLPAVLSHGSYVSESIVWQPMIRPYPDDKDAVSARSVRGMYNLLC
jgi:hypothetical protein